MHKIWGFGTSAIDIRIVTAEYGENYREKLLAQQSMWMGGGSTANFLVQAARLGCQAGWLGKLGKDAISSQILSLLQSEKVDCSAVIMDTATISPFNVAVYAGEHRRRIGGYLLPNALTGIDSADITHYVQTVCPGDYVLVEVGEIPIPTCIDFCRDVKAKGAIVVLDVDLDPIKQCGATLEQTQQIFSAADYLMPNINSLASFYSGMDALSMTKALAVQYDCHVVSTLGSRGAAYAGPGTEVALIPGLSIGFLIVIKPKYSPILITLLSLFIYVYCQKTNFASKSHLS